MNYHVLFFLPKHWGNWAILLLGKIIGNQLNLVPVSELVPGLPVWHTACPRWDCARGRRTRVRRRSRRGWGGSPPSWSSPTSATSTPSPSLSPPPLSRSGGGGGGEETRMSCLDLTRRCPGTHWHCIGDPRTEGRESRTAPHLSLSTARAILSPNFFLIYKRSSSLICFFMHGISSALFNSRYFPCCHFILCTLFSPNLSHLQTFFSSFAKVAPPLS